MLNTLMYVLAVTVHRVLNNSSRKVIIIYTYIPHGLILQVNEGLTPVRNKD